jgi:HEAT repeat protein
MKRMKQSAFCTVSAIGLFLSGCAQPTEPKVPTMPDPPAAVPKAVATPLDPALQSGAEAELSAAFTSGDAVLRANAVEASQRVNSVNLADRIDKGLNDSNPVVRFAAAMAAGSAQQKRHYKKLLELSNDSSAIVRVGTRYALHRLGDFRLSRDFEQLIQDRDARVRANTVLALGLLNEPSAMKLLSTTEMDPVAAVRLQTTEAMYRLGNVKAGERLMAGTISTYADDQIVCLLALAHGGRADDRVYKILQGNLTGDYVEVTLAAARAMGMIGSDEGMGVALAQVSSKDARQRAMAALALGAIGRADAQPSLAKLLKDNDPNVRLAAATAILQLKA